MKNEKKISDLIGELQWMFAIQNYDKRVAVAEKDVEDYAMTISFEEDYQRITFTVYPTFFKMSLKDQRRAILHEMCHTITNPMDTLIETLISGKIVTAENSRIILERSTCQIEAILDGMLQGKGFGYVKAYNNYIKQDATKKRKVKKNNGVKHERTNARKNGKVKKKSN